MVAENGSQLTFSPVVVEGTLFLNLDMEVAAHSSFIIILD